MVLTNPLLRSRSNGPSPECPTYLSLSRGFSPQDPDREADVERGCSRVQRQPKNRRQVAPPLPRPGAVRLAGSFLASLAQPAPNFVGAGRAGHRPASPVVSRLSHRPSHSAQSRHRQPHPATGSPEPLASSPSRSARGALRASRFRRSAASRHQGHDPLSAGLHARRWPSPRPPAVRRLASPARGHRRSLPPRLLPHAAQPASRNRHRLPARRRGLLLPARYRHPPPAHRQRLLLSLPTLPRRLPSTRHPAPLHPALHSPHQRQSRTLHSTLYPSEPG